MLLFSLSDLLHLCSMLTVTNVTVEHISKKSIKQKLKCSGMVNKMRAAHFIGYLRDERKPISEPMERMAFI